jgi:hypothetical protein
MTKYISFTGTFNVPTNHEELNIQFPMTYYHRHLGLNSHNEEIIEEYEQGFRSGGLIYNSLYSNLDGIDLYISVIENNIGHLVVQCLNGGWNEETFCFLDENGMPIHAEDNFNPNPVPQVC